MKKSGGKNGKKKRVKKNDHDPDHAIGNYGRFVVFEDMFLTKRKWRIDPVESDASG